MISTVVDFQERKTRKTAHQEIELINESVLALNARSIVWDIPPGLRTLNYSIPGGGYVSVDAPCPHLIAAVIQTRRNGLEFHLVALKRKGRPVSGTPIFHAPFMNVDEDGCFGLSESPDNSCITSSAIPEWMGLFDRMVMTNVSHARTIKLPDLKPGAKVSFYHHLRFWRELSRSSEAKFPNWSLIERRETLEGWFKSLSLRL